MYKEQNIKIEEDRLFLRQWMQNQPVDAVIIVHGIGEHSGRHIPAAEFFYSRGFSVYAFDLPGHGLSSGLRGHIDKFEDYIQILKTVRNLITGMNKNRKIFVLGQSLGALILIRYLERYSDIDAAVAISAPLALYNKVSRCKVLAAHLLNIVNPKICFLDTNVKAEYLTHDRRICREYDSDRLVFYQRSVRLYIGFNKARQCAFKQAAKIKIPMLILAGGCDKIISLDKLQEFYNQLGSLEKKFTVYDGLYHEILNEPAKETIILDILEWMKAQ